MFVFRLFSQNYSKELLQIAYDTVSDQKHIFRTYVLKFQVEKTKTPCIFSFTLGHGEMIFDDPHTKSVHLKIFVKFPILSGPNKYPFYYRTSTKINVKKKATPY